MQMAAGDLATLSAKFLISIPKNGSQRKGNGDRAGASRSFRKAKAFG
jgi:hypothetical protein